MPDSKVASHRRQKTGFRSANQVEVELIFMDNALEHCLEIRAPINIFSPDFSEGTAKAYSAGSEPGTWSLVRPCHKRSFALSAPDKSSFHNKKRRQP